MTLSNKKNKALGIYQELRKFTPDAWGAMQEISGKHNRTISLDDTREAAESLGWESTPDKEGGLVFTKQGEFTWELSHKGVQVRYYEQNGEFMRTEMILRPYIGDNLPKEVENFLVAKLGIPKEITVPVQEAFVPTGLRLNYRLPTQSLTLSGFKKLVGLLNEYLEAVEELNSLEG